MASSRGSIRQVPSGRYEARYRGHDGKRHGHTFSTRGEAQAWLNNVLVKLQRGEWTDPNSIKTTFSEWVEQWLAMNPNKRPTTLARDRTVLEVHFVPTLGTRRLPTIRPVDVQAIVAKMNSKLQPRTVATNYGVFRACLKAAEEADLIARSPCRGVKLETLERPEIRFLEREELDRLAASFPADYRAMVYVAGVLGLRWSEVVGLRVGRIDFLRRQLTVDQTVAEVNGRLLPAPVRRRPVGARWPCPRSWWRCCRSTY